MELRNKYLLITLRTIFGLALVAFGVMGLFFNPPTEGLTPATAAALQGLDALGVAQLIALAELIAGLLIITGFLPALGALLVAPITVGIIVFHLMREPSTIVPGIIFSALNLYFGYVYWEKYKSLFNYKKR